MCFRNNTDQRHYSFCFITLTIPSIILIGQMVITLDIPLSRNPWDNSHWQHYHM